MAAQFELEILTPERQFFVGLAEAIVLPSIDGSYGVQAGHEPSSRSNPVSCSTRSTEPGTVQRSVRALPRLCPSMSFCWPRRPSILRRSTRHAHAAPRNAPRNACARSRACRSITVPKPHWHAPWHDSKPASSKDLFSQTEHRICAPFFAVQTDFALDTRKNAVELSAACVIR